MKAVAPILGWVLAGLALLASFYLDFANTARGGAIDLRNRITGVRLLEAGIDPYHYKWHEGDPEIYCDVYNNPKLPISKTTVTPAMLVLHAPFALLPYRAGQMLWFLAQWTLLLATGAIWWRACAQPWQRWLVLAFVVGFTYTAAWRLHAERGQSYVVLAFLFSAWLALTLQRRWSDGFGAGVVAGLLVALRPTFLLLALFLGLHRRGQLAGAATGLAIGLIAPSLMLAAIWPDYLVAARENASLYLSGEIIVRPGEQSYPARIEGVPTDIAAHFEPISFADFSAHAVLNDLGLEFIPGWFFELAAIGAFGGWLWWTRREPMEKLLPGVAAWFFIIDPCLPVFRQSYNDVLALAVIGCALATAARWPWALSAGFFALGAGWFVAWDVPEERWLINLPALGFTAMALGLIFSSIIARRSARFDAAC